MPHPSRRNVLRGGLVLGLTATAGGVLALDPPGFGSAGSGSSNAQASGPHPWARSAFAALLGVRLAMVGEGWSGAVTLTDIADLAPAPAASEDAYALVFSAGPKAPAEQGTYRFTKRGVLDTQLFVVPGSRDSRAATYRAIVNRSSGTASGKVTAA